MSKREDFMRIVSWNCNGGFRKKAEVLFSLDADVYCVQECENPEKHGAAFERALNGCRIIWKGEDPKQDKGVAVIAKPDMEILRLDWSGSTLRDFLPVSICSTGLVVVNVWACKPYIENFNAWLDICRTRIGTNTILIGDFNSNKAWDYKHGVLCHSRAVTELDGLGLVSAYHHVTGEEQGKEDCSTFFLHKNGEKGYHIDGAFAAPAIIEGFEIADGDWMLWSDHVPIVLEVDENHSEFCDKAAVLKCDDADAKRIIGELQEGLFDVPAEVLVVFAEVAGRANLSLGEFLTLVMEKAALLSV